MVSSHAGTNCEGCSRIIDLGDECAVLVLVNGDDQPVAMEHVPSLPEDPGGQRTEDCPLPIVQIEVRARNLGGSPTEANLLSELADDGAVVLSDLSQPKAGPRHVPVHDLLRAHDSVGEARQQEPTLSLDDRVLQ